MDDSGADLKRQPFEKLYAVLLPVFMHLPYGSYC